MKTRVEIDDFTAQCPCCGDAVRKHEPESEEMHEYWTYECGAELVLIDGKLDDNEPCRDALRSKIRDFNRSKAA